MTQFSQQFIIPLWNFEESNELAFHINGNDYSYSQLFNVVEQVFEVIMKVPENLIGLYATDDIRTYASILALWFCGKTYIPLNPAQPKERHVEIVKIVKINYILSSDDSYEMDDVISVKTSSLQIEGYQRKNSISLIEVDDTTLAYIIFTSGSTGKPKGVQITRGNIVAFIDSMNHIGLEITSADRCLQPFDLTFDFSASSYLIPLTKGASIYTIPNKAVKFTSIVGLLDDYHLTVLQMVPSMIRNMLPYMDEIDISSVRYNILCGEALYVDTIKEWHKSNPEMVSYNMYGPTEDTVFCTYYTIDKNNVETIFHSNNIVSIGKTFKNNELCVLDENDKLVEDANVEGELCLCGAQLTPGYWKNDKENLEKFFELSGKLYYRSGDLCFYNEQKDLMYVSRRDSQVKINGFRVELGEIESLYKQISGKFAIVVPYTNKQGNTELAIVIEGSYYEYAEHKSFLASKLPKYELPSLWKFVRTLPLNTNGKIDRKKIVNSITIE